MIDFSPRSNQNGETLIKVRKVVSLLLGVDDRSGNSEHKASPCGHKNMHGCKNDPYADMSKK